MNLNWEFIIQTSAVLISTITMVFLYFEHRQMIEQMKNQIYASFVEEALEIDRVLIQYPQYRKYVLEKNVVPNNLPYEDQSRILGIEEMIIDSAENVAEYLLKIPEDQSETWCVYLEHITSTGAYKFHKVYAQQKGLAIYDDNHIEEYVKKYRDKHQKK